MSELVLSSAGEELLRLDMRFKSLVDEFALPKSRGMGGASYREFKLGQGGEAGVYSVRGYNMAERVLLSYPMHPGDQVLASFERGVRARNRWEELDLTESQLYVPKYYAAVEHPDKGGATLMERVGQGVAASDLLYLGSGLRSREEISTLLGSADLESLSVQVKQAFHREEALFRELFKLVSGSETEALSENMVVDYDPAAAGNCEIRLAAVDF